MRILALCLFLFPASGLWAQHQIAVEGKNIHLISDDNLLINVDSISFNYVSPASVQKVYDSPDSSVIQLNYRQVPDFNSLEEGYDRTVNLVITYQDGTFHLIADPRWAQSFTIHLPDDNDHYFGLIECLFPDNKKSPDLRGQVVDMEVNGHQYSLEENFASIWSAFYFNPKGYASFVNTFANGKYELGINGQTNIHHETGKLDWYVFTGNSTSIYRQYYGVIGQPKKIPLWSCGPMVWRDEIHGGSASILDDARQFAKLHIPLTSLMIDRPYSNGANLWSKMDFSEQFNHPEQWIKKLKDSFGMHVLTWIAPSTFYDEDFPGRLKGGMGYFDLSDPAAVTEFGTRLRNNQYRYGVHGHKMDRGDEQFPEEEGWHDGTPKAERKNKYIYLYAKVTDSILRQFYKGDQLNYARAAFQGCQQYLSGVWGGDPRSTWDGMSSNLANSMRASFMGFPNWGSDVGGYLGPTGKISDDLYCRWLQWDVFCGIDEIKLDGSGGSGEDRTPWKYGEKVQNAFRDACVQRMEWLPFIYSFLNTSGINGPLMKPLAMVFPGDTLTYNIWNEYIFGNSVLVAPMLSDKHNRSVYLPEGTWIDYYTGEIIPGRRYLEIPISFEQMPLYVSAGSILAKGNILQERNARGLYVDFYYYPGKGNNSFDFVDPKDNSLLIQIQGVSKTGSAMFTVPAMSYTGDIKIFAEKSPSRVRLNGRSCKSFYAGHMITIHRPVNKKCVVEASW